MPTPRARLPRPGSVAAWASFCAASDSATVFAMLAMCPFKPKRFLELRSSTSSEKSTAFRAPSSTWPAGSE
jgi:hypothetical protein